MDKTLCKPDTYERPESEVLELITAERARVKKPNGMYPLHYAAHYSKSKAVVDALIAEFPEALQAKNNFGETPGVHATQTCPSLRRARTISRLSPPPFALPLHCALSRLQSSECALRSIPWLQVAAQSHSKSAEVKAVFAAAEARACGSCHVLANSG